MSLFGEEREQFLYIIDPLKKQIRNMDPEISKFSETRVLRKTLGPWESRCYGIPFDDLLVFRSMV